MAMNVNILDQYLKKYDALALEQEKKDDYELLQTKREAVEFFEKMRVDKVALPIVFDFADKDGNLHRMEESGLSLLMPRKELGKDIYRLQGLAGEEITCYVDSIDEESGKVVFRTMSRRELKERFDFEGAIQAKLGRGEEVIIYGTIRTILSHGVVVSIYGSPVTGYCPISEWSNGYTHNMDVACRQNGIYVTGTEGQHFKFRVIKKQKPNRSFRPRYILSHKEFTKDPWKDFPSEIKKDSVVVLNCVAKPEASDLRKQYWWGISSRFKGIDVLCDNSDKFEISLGTSYKCKITMVDLENRKISASPFAVAEDMEEQDRRLEQLVKRSFENKLRKGGI